MRGKVIGYGDMGDPLIRPDNGGKLVFLKKYDTLPKIGDEVDYEISRFNRGSTVLFAHPTEPEQS